jgi:ABC-type multidrug transport system ATPase subunit
MTVSGNIVCDGKNIQSHSFRSRVAYVTQNDTETHIPELSVRETLKFSALLRMPPSTTSAQMHKLITTLLKVFGLSHVEDVCVGESN